MLLKLPPDLLVEIALYLSTAQKLQLVLTCKRLKDAIFKRCLYETLNIPRRRGQDKTESFVLEFRKNKYKGHQVKSLTISLDQLPDQLYSEIPLIFPNVVKFDDRSYDRHPRSEEVCKEFKKWKDKLEELRDIRGVEAGALYQLLEKNVFSRLTNLSISVVKDDGKCINFSECIKNVPALKSLTIEDHVITLEMMESIHSMCPLLTTFRMDACLIHVTENVTLPKKIVPALRLSHFSLDDTAILDQQCVFLAYLTRKYTNLVKFTFNLSFSEKLLQPLYPISEISELGSDPDFIARRNGLRLTEEAYTVSASKMLSDLPSTLKIFYMFTTNIHDAGIIFSKSCVNVTRIEFLAVSNVHGTIFTPTDIEVFREMPFLKHLSILFEPSLLKYEQMPASSSVTHLTIVMKGELLRKDIDIGWILFMFPSLEFLNIRYSGVRLTGYETSPPKIYPNLTSIVIGPSATHPDLLKFIRHAAPNLKSLHCFISGKVAKEACQANQVNSDVVIRPNRPKIENGRAHYTIDLTGFSLNNFSLEIDLREKFTENTSDIVLNLNNKDNKSKQFFISDTFESITLANSKNEHLKEQIKTIVTIQYDYTKVIMINSKFSINLEKSQIQLKYRM